MFNKTFMRQILALLALLLVFNYANTQECSLPGMKSK